MESYLDNKLLFTMKRKFENVQNPQHINPSLDEDSDLSIRRSPKPINNALKHYQHNNQPNQSTKNQNLTELNIVPPQYQHSTVDNQIQYLWSDWRNIRLLSAPQTEIINGILENVECSHQDILLLFYLKQRAEVQSLTKKIHNANLNIQFLELKDAQSKKLVLLKLLTEKLNKKMFFAKMILRKYRKKLLLIQKQRINYKQIIQKIQHLVKNTQKIIHQRQIWAMSKIQEVSKLKKLLTSHNSFTINEDSQNFNHNNFGKSYDSLDNQTQKLQEQSGLDVRQQGSIIYGEFPESSSQYSPQDIIATIKRLQLQAKLVRSKYMQRTQKLKRLYFISWKITFLYKHLQQVLLNNQHHNLLVKFFFLLKTAKGRESFVSQNSVQSQDNVQKISQMLKLHNFRKLKKNIKQKFDVKKIYQYISQIYSSNLLHKAFKALQQTRKGSYPKHSYSEQQEQEQSHGYRNQSRKQSNYENRESFDRYLNKSIQLDEIQSYTKQENLKVKIFRQAHLQTKFFFIMKNILCINKLFKTLNTALLKQGFSHITERCQKNARMQKRVERLITNKNKVIIFRCFRVMKQLMYTNQSAQVYIKHKQKIMMENSFSILKLLWKQMLIRLKKVQIFHNHMQKKRTLDLLQVSLLPKVLIQRKKRIFLQKRQQKYFRIFMKQILSNCIHRKKASKRQMSINRHMDYQKYRLISECFGGWNRIYKQKKSYQKVLSEYCKSKSRNLKKNVFWLWMRMALLRRKNFITSMQQTTSIREQTMVSESESLKLQLSSQDHKFWLSKYYQQICAFDT